MKKYFGLILLTVFCLSCEKEKNELPEEKEKIREVSIETEYTYDIHCYKENIEYESPLAYYGDTIRYKIKFKSEVEIKFLKVYYISDETDSKYEVYPDYYGQEIKVNTIDINKLEDSLTYVYPLDSDKFSYIYHGDGGWQSTSFIFDFHDSTGVIKSDTLPSFGLKYFLEMENHQRLYNIANKEKGYARGFKYYVSDLKAYDFSFHINCGGACLQTNDSGLFMVNIPNNDYLVENDSAITKDFINGWYAPGGNHYFAKVEKQIQYYEYATPTEVRFKEVSKPWHLKDIYSNNEPKLTKIENPKVGDLYVFRYIHHLPHVGTSERPLYYWGDVYGIIEITHIEDDGLTSDNGGNELDYIEFRTKSFGESNRFQ